MKNSKLPLFIIALFVGTIMVVSGIYVLASNLLKKDKSGDADCSKIGQTHLVNIKNSLANPDHIDAKLCDKLTITNQDYRVHEMAFGQHDDHVPYDGVTEEVLAKDQSLTVTLIQAGNFEFHDHIGDVAAGDFTVTN